MELKVLLEYYQKIHGGKIILLHSWISSQNTIILGSSLQILNPNFKNRESIPEGEESE